MSKRMIDSEMIGVLDGSEKLLDSLSGTDIRLCKMLDDDGNQFGWVMIKDAPTINKTLPWYGYIKTNNARNYPAGYFYKIDFSGGEASSAKFNSDGDIIFPSSYFGQSTQWKPYMILIKDSLSSMYLNTAEYHSIKFTLTKSGSTEDEIFYYTFVLPRKDGYSISSITSADDFGKWGNFTYFLDSAGTQLRISSHYDRPSGKYVYSANWTASDGTPRTVKTISDEAHGPLYGGAGM